MKSYTEKEIVTFAKAIDGDEESYRWLIENHFAELAATADVITNHNDTALSWLKKNKQITLVAFISALGEDKNAMTFLISQKHILFASVVGAVEGEVVPFNWLAKNNLGFYLLAKTLINYFRSYRRYRTIWSSTDFTSDGDTNDSTHLGGGDFGGAGAGGKW